MKRPVEVRKRLGSPQWAKYTVLLVFPRQAGFQMNLEAAGPKMARRLATDAARLCGWDTSRRPLQVKVITTNRRRTAE